MGRSYYRGMALHLRTINESEPWQPGMQLHDELFESSFFITRKEFPAYVFPKMGQATAALIFRGDVKPNLADILSFAKRVFKGTKAVPVYYDDDIPVFPDSPAQRRIIEERNAQPVYLRIRGPARLPLKEHVARWSDDCELSHHRPAASTVKKYFALFSAASRFIQIALHYFQNASNLIHLRFIEEAGLNLQLTVDAIVLDFMVTHSIRSKPRAIEALQRSVSLPYFHMEFLGELYDARNRFLAHVDTDMFTMQENINNPDGYCYEHYESVCWLITRYIQYKTTTTA